MLSHKWKMRLLAFLGASFSLLILFKVHPLAAAGPAIAVLVLFSYILWGVTGPMFFSIVLFLRPGEMIHPAFEKLMLGKLTALACLGFWFIHFIFLNRRHITRDILAKLMLALTASIVICSIKSTVPGHSQQYLNEVWLKLVILFFAISHLLIKPRALSIYVATLMGLTVILGLMGLHKGLTATPDQLVEGNRVGLGSLFGDPNDYAQMLLACGFSYFLNSILLAPKKWLKVVLIVGMLSVVSGVFMARSRGGFLGFAASSMLIMRSRMSPVVLMGAGGVMGGLGMVFMMVADRATASSADGGIDESAQGRLDAWKAAIRMFLKNPLFGVGYECYPYNYLSYVTNPVDWKPKAVHSSWLKVIAELGMSGMFFFFGMIGVSLKRAYELDQWALKTRISRRGNWFVEAIYRSMFPSLVAWCVCGTFLSNSFTWFLYVQIAIVIAATTARDYIDEWLAAHPEPEAA